MKHLLTTCALLAGLASPALAEDLKMATIAPGSSAYLTMSTMATLVNGAQSEHQITVDATGAASKHMIDLARGDLDFAMTSPVLYGLMKEQKAMYQKFDAAPELSKALRLVFWFPYGPTHYIVYADSGIETLADLEDKTVFLGPPGGGAWESAREWVEAQTGLVVNEDFKNFKGSWSSAFQAFQDRQVDVYAVGGLPPFPQMEQLTATSEMRLLGPTKAEIDAMDAAALAPSQKPGRTLETIPVEVYGDGLVNSEDVYTYGAWVGVTTRADLDEETVYEVTKAFWEAAEAARADTPWLKEITLKQAVAEGGMALHPGAQRYYEEAGVEIPAGSAAAAN